MVMRKIYTKITYFEVNPDAALHSKLTAHLENKSGNLNKHDNVLLFQDCRSSQG